MTILLSIIYFFTGMFLGGILTSMVYERRLAVQCEEWRKAHRVLIRKLERLEKESK